MSDKQKIRVDLKDVFQMLKPHTHESMAKVSLLTTFLISHMSFLYVNGVRDKTLIIKNNTNHDEYQLVFDDHPNGYILDKVYKVTVFDLD